jgi:hypothetical protein
MEPTDFGSLIRDHCADLASNLLKCRGTNDDARRLPQLLNRTSSSLVLDLRRQQDQEAKCRREAFAVARCVGQYVCKDEQDAAIRECAARTPEGKRTEACLVSFASLESCFMKYGLPLPVAWENKKDKSIQNER